MNFKLILMLLERKCNQHRMLMKLKNNTISVFTIMKERHIRNQPTYAVILHVSWPITRNLKNIIFWTNKMVNACVIKSMKLTQKQTDSMTSQDSLMNANKVYRRKQINSEEKKVAIIRNVMSTGIRLKLSCMITVTVGHFLSKHLNL